MPRKGRTRKKNRTHVVEDETAQSALASNDAVKHIPRSVVVRRGRVENEVSELIGDLRRLMLPHTALNLNSSLTQRLKLVDYAKQLSGTAGLGVTHILSFSQNEALLNLRIARTPAGPTLSFRVSRYALSKHVRAAQKRPLDVSTARQNTLFQHAPVVVTNNFGDADAKPHVKLMRITFQNMFPAVNVADVKLDHCRRVVLFNFLPQDDAKKDGEDEVEVRHYAVRAAQVGVDKKVRRILQRKLPNLSRLDDVSDYILGSSNNSTNYQSDAASDSEAEDETSHVVLPQNYRGVQKSQKSALKLVEIGPRMRLTLLKVERGLGAGDVMYHAHQTKTPEQARATKHKVDQEAALRKRRREEQEANVKRKTQEKDDKTEKKRLKKEERERETMEGLRAGGARNYDDVEEENDSESESEAGEEDASSSNEDMDNEESEDEESD